MPYPVKGFLEINENMVQSLLMLEVHSGLKLYSVVLLPALDPANNVFGLGFKVGSCPNDDDSDQILFCPFLYSI